VHARANINRFGRKTLAHPVVKDMQTSLPKSVVTIFFAVLYDPAVDLVDLFEAAVFHEYR
jgi:hypothetical protein